MVTVASAAPEAPQPEIGTRAKSVIAVDGLRFRDSDGDGALARFEDWRVPAEQRADDLVSRMTLEEKVGTLMHANLPGQGSAIGQGAGYDLEALEDLVAGRKITSFITRLATEPARFAEENNKAQQVAERERLGIPLTVSTDPRNHFQYVLGASASAKGMTQWPELLGFAALGDAARVREFGEIARKEYRAVGIHMALSPQLDLLTEPRWSRGTGTFGSDADTASALGAAYVAGFQGSDSGLARQGVLTVVKHWVAYGAQPEGFDAHSYYGRFARPGASFQAHVDAFRGALAAGAGGVMPAYPILEDVTVDGQRVEPVAPGFSKVLLEVLLRQKMGFRGMVLSDWAITRDCDRRCMAPTSEEPQGVQDIGTSWGVQDLTVEQRYVLGIEAGIDQFGGTDDVGPLVRAVRAGTVSADRIDAAVRRVLIPKFQLGLFENPYVDPSAVASLVGAPADRTLAERTQREAQVLLTNRGSALPFAKGKVWLFGIDPAAARAAGLEVVDDPATADFAIIRAESPSEMLHPHHFFGTRQKEGRLDFRPGDPAYDALVRASARVPTVFAVFLDRPAILTDVQDKASVILANFGASDAAILDVVLGHARAKGRLPFELPSSMAAVEAQDPGKADDSAAPLFRRGAGLVER